MKLVRKRSISCLGKCLYNEMFGGFRDGLGQTTSSHEPHVCVCVKLCSKDAGPAGSDKVKNSNNEELYVDGRFNHGIGYSNNSHDIYSSSNTAADFRV